MNNKKNETIEILEGETHVQLYVAAAITGQELANPLQILNARVKNKIDIRGKNTFEYQMMGGNWEVYRLVGRRVMLDEIYFRNGYVGFSDLLSPSKNGSDEIFLECQNNNDVDFKMLKKEEAVRQMLVSAKVQSLNLNEFEYERRFVNDNDRLVQIVISLKNSAEYMNEKHPNMPAIHRYYGTDGALKRNLEEISKHAEQTSVTFLDPEYVREKLEGAKARCLVRASTVFPLDESFGGNVVLTKRWNGSVCYGLGIQKV
jgi:hypothetical protein